MLYQIKLKKYKAKDQKEEDEKWISKKQFQSTDKDKQSQTKISKFPITISIRTETSRFVWPTRIIPNKKSTKQIINLRKTNISHYNLISAADKRSEKWISKCLKFIDKS
jgi:hypothetical protein